MLLEVLSLDVGKQATTLTDEHEQAATSVEVLLVALHVLGEALEALREQGNLDGCGAGVLLVLAVLLDELGLALLGDCHVEPLSFFGYAPDRDGRQAVGGPLGAG